MAKDSALATASAGIAADLRTALAISENMRDADDNKLRKIAELVGDVTDPAVNASVLDPIRARLAVLRPPRLLRFTRLLFIPLQPLIVQPDNWTPGAPSVPRHLLRFIASMVRAELGPEADRIDRMIAPYTVADTRMVTGAGAALWPVAGAILARADVPADWLESGLPDTVFRNLAKAVGAVLARAPEIRTLCEDGELGAVASDEPDVNEIMRNVAAECPLGAAMIARLIVTQAPRAVPVLRRFADARPNRQEKLLLQTAIAQGIEIFLSGLETEAGLSSAVGKAPLPIVGDQIGGIAALLHEAEYGACPGISDDRLQAIKERLNRACQARFAAGLRDGLLTPLTTAPGPMAGEAQIGLESRGRDLRKLEMAARTFGGADSYDRLLQQATATVQAAARTGTLTPVRKFRLIEMLAGPEAADALYTKETNSGG